MNFTSNIARSQGNGLDKAGEDDFFGGLDGRDVVFHSVGVKVWVILDRGNGVGGSVSASLSSNNDPGVCGGSSDGTVRCRYGPAFVAYTATAEVDVEARTQRHLVGELARVGNGSSNDTSLPLVELGPGEDRG